ncbi:hypothetical protein B0H11DRAFT_1970947 [Mycena galericulata]|nr:hypothetical protein B0H11DRAFT_1970947 [Mycena galericulata]
MAKRKRPNNTQAPPSPSRIEFIKARLIAAMADPKFKFTLPWVRQTTWKDMSSPDSAVREGFRVKGRIAIRYALLLVFEGQISKDGEASYSPGFYSSIEECVLSEEVLSELLAQPRHNGEQRIVGEGVGYVTHGFNIFIGGLWQDVGGLGKITAFVESAFAPLVSVAIKSYRSFSPPKRARSCAGGGANCSELRVLERIRKLQLAKKPEKSWKSNQPAGLVPSIVVPTPPPCVSPTTDLSLGNSSSQEHLDDDIDELESDEDQDETPQTRPALISLADATDIDELDSDQDQEDQGRTSILRSMPLSTRKHPTRSAKLDSDGEGDDEDFSAPDDLKTGAAQDLDGGVDDQDPPVLRSVFSLATEDGVSPRSGGEYDNAALLDPFSFTSRTFKTTAPADRHSPPRTATSPRMPLSPRNLNTDSISNPVVVPSLYTMSPLGTGSP